MAVMAVISSQVATLVYHCISHWSEVLSPSAKQPVLTPQSNRTPYLVIDHPVLFLSLLNLRGFHEPKPIPQRSKNIPVFPHPLLR